jgi:hypothetical protein
MAELAGSCTSCTIKKKLVLLYSAHIHVHRC